MQKASSLSKQAPPTRFLHTGCWQPDSLLLGVKNVLAHHFSKLC